MKKKTILILGKLPPPFFGPAIATEIILKSSIKEWFDLVHVDTRLNEKMSDMGKINIPQKQYKIVKIYFNYLKTIFRVHPAVILVPVGQDTIAFIKDSFFIFFGRLSGSKLVVHLRGSDWLNWQRNSSPVTRFYVRAILALCSGGIVLGNNLRYLFTPYFSHERIFVVPNGADYNIPEKKPNDTIPGILFFSNLYESKGLREVLTASKISEEQKYSIHYGLGRCMV